MIVFLSAVETPTQAFCCAPETKGSRPARSSLAADKPGTKTQEGRV